MDFLDGKVKKYNFLLKNGIFGLRYWTAAQFIMQSTSGKLLTKLSENKKPNEQVRTSYFEKRASNEEE